MNHLQPVTMSEPGFVIYSPTHSICAVGHVRNDKA